MARPSLILGAALAAAAAAAIVGSVDADDHESGNNEGYFKRYPHSSAYFRGYSNGRNKMHDTLFVVGDSISDNGNMKMYTSGAYPYARRQYSNARVWNERWAMENKYLLINKAFGGATISTSINPTFSGPDEEWPMPGIVQQMDMLFYAGAYKKCMDENNNINCIMVLQGISNDGLQELNKFIYATSTGTLTQEEATSTLVSNMAALIPPMIQKSIDYGFKKIVVTTAFPGSPTPYVKNFPAPLPQAIALLEGVVQQAVLGAIDGVKQANPLVEIVVWDMFTEVIEYLAGNPADLDIETPCIVAYGGDICATPRKNFWWDSVHPNSVVHQMLADNFAAVVTPLL